MFFSAITNWQILTKNSVTFKRSDGVMDEKFITLQWELPRKVGAWTVSKFKVGILQKSVGGVFEGGGGLICRCTPCIGREWPS